MTCGECERLKNSKEALWQSYQRQKTLEQFRFVRGSQIDRENRLAARRLQNYLSEAPMVLTLLELV
jgi:hypothetical protein